MMWRRLALPLALVLVLAGAAVVVLYARADREGREDLELEAGKAAFHVIAAVLAGNVVLAIVRDYQERKRSWQARRDLVRQDLTEGLAELYSNAKKTRRLLRASVDAKGAIEKVRYDDLLREVNDIQLGLERYKRSSKVGVRVGILPEGVSLELGSMESYLGELVREYEQALSADAEALLLTDLKWLRDFVGPYSTSGFRKQFVHPYSRVTKAVDDVFEADLRLS